MTAIAVQSVPAAAAPIDVVNTAAALATAASETRGYSDMRNAALWSMTDSDCTDFGAHGVCLSFGGRYANQSGDFSEAAGRVIAAMPIGKNFHAGLFLDYAESTSSPDGFDVKDAMPAFGGFIGFRATPGAGGFGLRLSGAWQSGDVEVTRRALAGTEAGRGGADAHSYVLNAEANYGLWLGPCETVTLFAALRQSEVSRDAYAETAGAAFPIAYGEFSQKVSTATLGARVARRISKNAHIRARLGVERDLDEKTTDFSGVSAIPGLTSFAAGGQSADRSTRVFGSTGMTLQLAPGRAVSVDATIRQRMNSGGVGGAITVGYQLGF